MSKEDCIKDMADMTIEERRSYTMVVMMATIVNLRKGISWKSKFNTEGGPAEFYPGRPIEGYFYVGIDTFEGPVVAMISDEHWDLFECKELERAKANSTDDDINRLLSLI